jgi:hypothetical protein
LGLAAQLGNHTVENPLCFRIVHLPSMPGGSAPSRRPRPW